MADASDVKHILTIAAAAVDAIESVTKIARQTLDQKPGKLEAVLSVLSAIAAVGETVAAGIRGEVSVEMVQDALTEMRATVSQNDLAADTSLDAKFR